MIGGPRLAIYSAWANRRVPAYQTSCPKPWDNQAVRNQKLLENNLGGKSAPWTGNRFSICKGLKWIGKPDSVMARNRATATIHLAPRLLKGSSDHTRGLWADHPALLFGLAPGGVCRAFAITGEPVSSYLAISTLPSAEAEGGIFSVVLSPDHSEPSLTATLSCGVRTFLPT
jgi:hypothetical protein